MNYDAYIQSPTWFRVRDRELERAGYCCEFCGHHNQDDRKERWTGLHVHHLTYDNLGAELSDDLIVLCSDCHADVHDFPRVADQVELFAIRRRQLHRALEDAEAK